MFLSLSTFSLRVLMVKGNKSFFKFNVKITFYVTSDIASCGFTHGSKYNTTITGIVNLGH